MGHGPPRRHRHDPRRLRTGRAAAPGATDSRSGGEPAACADRRGGQRGDPHRWAWAQAPHREHRPRRRLRRRGLPTGGRTGDANCHDADDRSCFPFFCKSGLAPAHTGAAAQPGSPCGARAAAVRAAAVSGRHRAGRRLLDALGRPGAVDFGVDSRAGGAHRRGHHHHRDGPGARLWRHVGRFSQADPDRVRPVHRVRRVLVLPVVLQLLRRGRRMSKATDLPGFEVPLHRSLTEPILLGGAPRTVAIANGTLAAAVGLGLQLWIPGVVLWIVGHSLARPALLADWLPWAGLIAPGVVLNKDGSFQRTARFRGPDLDSATQGELIATSARLNNALRRMGSGWALFIEAERRAAADYPHSDFPEPLSWLVDEERRAAFEESGTHFESGYHLTLVYLPPEESRARAAGMLYENRPTEGVDWRERLTAFIAETDRVFDLLDGVMPEIAWLDDSQTLTYLHAAISTRRYRVGVPEVPFHLDALLADAPLVGGLAPMLGDQHLRIATVRGFPTSTWPGILDDLNRLGFAYRWSTRFLCLDKAEAERELGRLRRQWFAKRKNVIALLRETIFQQESPLVDTDASNKAADADAALQELGSDQVAFGYLTATVTVLDADPAVADEKLRMSMPGCRPSPATHTRTCVSPSFRR
ncbi:hypothetical protein G6F31_012574 [Rhizopus arrhizus]|nr:hypothetical protein G6F31_012574 [Rhizopus arrhizus]